MEIFSGKNVIQVRDKNFRPPQTRRQVSATGSQAHDSKADDRSQANDRSQADDSKADDRSQADDSKADDRSQADDSKADVRSQADDKIQADDSKGRRVKRQDNLIESRRQVTSRRLNKVEIGQIGFSFCLQVATLARTWYVIASNSDAKTDDNSI